MCGWSLEELDEEGLVEDGLVSGSRDENSRVLVSGVFI